MPTVAFATLGCKVNLYETERIRADFESRGYAVVGPDSDADVYVVNTCSVTQVAEGKSRRLIGRLRRRSPRSAIIVTGCDVEMARRTGRALPPDVIVVGNRDKLDAVRFVPDARGVASAQASRKPAASAPARRTRALLKVQDGCDQFCSYCSVPLTRGPVCSRPMPEVLAEAEREIEQGRREIVVTGVLVGAYGADRDKGGANLAVLLTRLSEICGVRRLRLSSIEPTHVGDELLRVFSTAPAMCPHIHIPLQSGDDAVLRRMNRPYSADAYLRLVEKAMACVPDLAITTDVMVGFPGEDAAAFRNTVRVAEQAGFARMHVFRYSARPGTPAAGWTGQVSSEEKADRFEEMAQIAGRLQLAYGQRFVGRTMEVLVEGGTGRGSPMSGYTRNYIRVRFAGPACAPGSLTDVKLTQADASGAIGVLDV